LVSAHIHADVAAVAVVHVHGYARQKVKIASFRVHFRVPSLAGEAEESI
jgi:hypothetical protein